MKWKTLVLVLLVVAIVSMIGFSYYFGGPDYVEILRKPFGEITSFMTKAVFGANKPFAVMLDTDKGSFSGMSFHLVNSTVKLEGNIVYMKIDDTVVNKANKVVIGNINGEASVSQEGIVTVKGETASLAVNDVFLSQTGNNLNVEVAATPDKLFVSSVTEGKLAFPAVTGSLTVGLKTTTVSNLDAAKLEMSDFRGSLSFDEKAELGGTATKVVVNGQEISVTLQ